MALQQIIRPSKMPEVTGEAISTNYLRSKQGTLPTPIKIGKRASGWISSEVEAVQQARIRGDSESEIKELVRRLIAQRSAQPA